MSTTASTSAATSSTAWRRPRPSGRSSADSIRSAAAGARSATGCATGSSRVSVTGASPSRSTFRSSSLTRPATLGERPRTRFAMTSRSRSTSPSCRCAGPLARVGDWRFFQRHGRWFARETYTMPQWAGSCWYYLRFLDPRDDDKPWAMDAYDAWMPVDLYVGGAEHAVLHLLYARFWHKVFFDLGLVHTQEPFQKLLNPGMILGHSYRFYDDNLADDPKAAARRFASADVLLA